MILVIYVVYITERFGVALGSCMQNNLMPYLHEISLSEDNDVETFFNHQLIQFVNDISDLCGLHYREVRSGTRQLYAE